MDQSVVSTQEQPVAVSEICDGPTEKTAPAIDRALWQFVKFCIVGASNFALDFGTSYILTYQFRLDWRLANTISFLVGVSNSFFWNSRWTFKTGATSGRNGQYLLFVGINIIGLALNLSLMSAVIWAMAGTLHDRPDRLHFLAAKLCATAIVVTWNFLANKKWTFRA